MENSIFTKLNTLYQRYQDIAGFLADPAVMNDQNRYRELSKEYASYQEIVQVFQQYLKNREEITAAEAMLAEADVELKVLAEEEVKNLQVAQEVLEKQIMVLLLPSDPNDKRNIFLEIRAGTGGDEASLFAGDLFRMYSRYAEEQGWRVEIISVSEGEHGGYKEIISRISGKDVYSRLKFESGVHRVQRVPATEAQGRIHTSTCTVAVLPENDEIEAITINPADLRVDTYRSSGAGGQHVNVTNSAVRITHIPTNTVVECQDERSQHQNRARAMSLLQARILANEQEKQRREQEQNRRNLVGGAERSEKIRTYNFPQSRVTDHRINLTLYSLAAVMEGKLMPLIEALVREHQADLMATVGEK
jgi:peptide chain release factor 1